MRRLLAHRNARLYLSGQVMSLLGDGALWLAMGIWIKVLTGSSAAAGLSWIIVGIMTLFQRRTPPELMGRTDAAFTVVYAVPQTIAIALGAGLIAVLDYRILLLGIAGLMALAAGYLGTRREQRQAAAAGVPEPAAGVPEPAAAMAD